MAGSVLLMCVHVDQRECMDPYRCLCKHRCVPVCVSTHVSADGCVWTHMSVHMCGDPWKTPCVCVWICVSTQMCVYHWECS